MRTKQPSHTRFGAGARHRGAYAEVAGQNLFKAQLHAARKELTSQRDTIQELKKRIIHLKETASRDDLTGLYNRKEAEVLFKAMCDGAKREDKIVAIMMVDLDYFKSVNDTYGHPVGDAVLRNTSKTIIGKSRTTDVAIRWGGEEICLIYTCKSSETGSAHAERLRSAIEDMDLTKDGCPKVVTASIGVHFLDPKMLQDDCTLAQEIKVADQLLYHSKQKGGRNCITILSPEGELTVFSRGQVPKPAQRVATVQEEQPTPPAGPLSKLGALLSRLKPAFTR